LAQRKTTCASEFPSSRHRGTRESLTELLERANSLRFVGAHPNGEEALQQIPTEEPDVVLMDINLPRMNGIECVSRLKARMPKTQVLMLTTYEESDLISIRCARAPAVICSRTRRPRI